MQWPEHEGDPGGRLGQGLEGAREGYLLIRPSGRLAASNAAMVNFFPALAATLVPGTHISRLLAAALSRGFSTGTRRASRLAVRHQVLGIATTQAELRLHDGRWLRIGGTLTPDGGMLVICIDVTAAHEHAEALDIARCDREIVVQKLAQGICLYAPDATVRLANARYSELLGINPALPRPGATMRSLLAASIEAGHHGERSLDGMEQACLALVARGEKRRLVLTLSTGLLVAFDHIPLENGGWLATFEDITERRRIEERAAFLARHDALTRLPNRTMLSERLEQAIAASGRGVRFALLCLNLDHFKIINDTLGHKFGDRLLRAVGERLLACVRETDIVCRLGGDEFAIIQTDIEQAEHSAELGHRMLRALAAPFRLDGEHVNVSGCIGIAIGPDDGTHGDALLRHADTAMVRAKRDGEGTCRLFEPEMDARVQARRGMETALRRALADGAFELYYQPLVDVQANRVTGFEALLRWRHPDGTMVPPAQFITLAEEIGIIVPLGAWVMHAACAVAASWPAGLRIAVNVSAMQFKTSGLAACVTSALAASGLPARRLELEITESVLLADNAATLDVLRDMRARGVRISMDDFGTGHSSLSYLRSFPFDKIKIDQSFVRDLEDSADSAAIIGAIIGLGRSLGMRVTAEGVETAGQLDHLRAAGCDEVQGYYFSRPRPGGEVAGIIARIEGELVDAK
jgi:diguanylate cyclase (GGDEF)-like protein